MRSIERRLARLEKQLIERKEGESIAPTAEKSTLRLLRLERKITQERLAALSGLARGWVGYLERNPEAMTSTAAEKLAAALGVSTTALLA